MNTNQITDLSHRPLLSSIALGWQNIIVEHLHYLPGEPTMQLAGPGVWGSPRDPDAAVAVLREALEATPMQVSLGWLLQRAPNILLIPGTSSVDHLRENLKAADLRLPRQIITDLNVIVAQSNP